MSEESKLVDPTEEKQAETQAAEALVDLSSTKAKTTAESDAESGDEAEETQTGGGDGSAETSGKKKKKSKRKKAKQAVASALGRGELTAAQVQENPMKAISGLTDDQIKEFMTLNPALMNDLLGAEGSSSSESSAIEAFRRLKLQDIMTGLATSGKNRKDMASYKFWSTQPVPQFDEEPKALFEEGPLKIQKVDEIPAEPIPLALPQFRWVTMDLTDDKQLEEVEKLLYGHYVEDDEAMFRFKYSASLLRWSLMSPGWKKEWHVGIRTGDTLCAFISAIPTEMRVRGNIIPGSEVNFLCIHKKLRGKRLAPILIKEITRRINRDGIWQAIYTGGIVLPRPVSTCRYYHRALDWQKLYEVGFSPCPPNSTPKMQQIRYRVAANTSTRGLRELESRDIEAVHNLLDRYLKRYDLTPVWNKEEFEHWMLHKKDAPGQQVIWSYVIEGDDGKITDFFSFYCLESSVIRSAKHSAIRAAYMFYYASETAFASTPEDRPALGKRLNALMADAIILAKKHNFDVFNALSIMDNPLFLEQQKFGPGDGQLHYYLFNYKANPIYGGVNKNNQLEEGVSSGVGFTML
ncbi:putative glycylpeptide N-tetradecanoyltransferase [Podospora australis]|uniref:Glycylpeptide N-tetradecanoyltransferase n=1 Tax=Podospora australis TaxID=1536484 RepID=A0AAN7AEQ7_9PEZI|nr:putative glycylpeptide N-tetradecanoyltransferase [Podospora australis]